MLGAYVAHKQARIDRELTALAATLDIQESHTFVVASPCSLVVFVEDIISH